MISINLCNNIKTRVMIVSIIIFISITLGLVLLNTKGCQINRLFGLSCHGCGGTRMIRSLLDLEIYQAFRYNPFMFITIPIVITIYTYESYIFIRYSRVSKHLDKILIVYGISTIIFGIIRNISILHWLLPTEIK